MGILDFIKSPIKELYIARPPEAAEHLIYKHPDETVPKDAKLTVRSDEVCLFFQQGRFKGQLQAGSYRLDSGNIPWVGELIIDKFTGGNHYISEIFFVRKAEYLQKSGTRKLARYRDQMSGLYLTTNYSIQFGLKATDPLKLITTLSGMDASSAEKLQEFFNGRIESHLKQAAGNQAAQLSIDRLISGERNEVIGQDLKRLCEAEFENQGLELTRFVNMTISLDEESGRRLEEFGDARSDLQLQREGSHIANNPGFANFHVAQGQRSALEGLGEGMASGGNSAPILGVGIGLGTGASAPMVGGGGGFMQPPSSNPPGAGYPGGSPRGNTPPAMLRWYLRTAGGTEGPYTIRQLVLRVIAEDETLDTAMIRAENDPSWFSAAEEESVCKEYERRQKSKKRPKKKATAAEAPGRNTDAFETLFTVAVEDQVLTREEINMLAPLAISAGMAEDIAGAQKIVIQRAKAYGCEIEPEFEAEVAASNQRSSMVAPPPPRPPTNAPPPPRPTLYSYDNGRETLHHLTASQVVEQMRTSPQGSHLVWSPGMTGWVAVADVEEIQALLESSEG